MAVWEMTWSMKLVCTITGIKATSHNFNNEHHIHSNSTRLQPYEFVILSFLYIFHLVSSAVRNLQRATFQTKDKAVCSVCCQQQQSNQSAGHGTAHKSQPSKAIKKHICKDDALLQPRKSTSSIPSTAVGSSLQQHLESTLLTLPIQVFLLLVAEMALFVLLIIPLPFTIRRKMFTFMCVSSTMRLMV